MAQAEPRNARSRKASAGPDRAEVRNQKPEFRIEDTREEPQIKADEHGWKGRLGPRLRLR